MAYDDSGVDVESVQERCGVGHEVGVAIVVLGATRVPVASLREGQSTDGARQMLHQQFEGVPGVAETV
jgi:hypothetical protein